MTKLSGPQIFTICPFTEKACQSPALKYISLLLILEVNGVVTSVEAEVS